MKKLISALLLSLLAMTATATAQKAGNGTPRLLVTDIFEFSEPILDADGWYENFPFVSFKNRQAMEKSMARLSAENISFPWSVWVYEGCDSDGRDSFSCIEGLRTVYVAPNAQINYTYFEHDGSEINQVSIEFDDEKAQKAFVDSAKAKGFYSYGDPEDIGPFVERYSHDGSLWVMEVNGMYITFFPNVG